jgi:hypothetical protein
MTDDNAPHLIRDLPPVVEAPKLPGEGGTQRKHAPAEPRRTVRRTRRSADADDASDRP